MVGNPVVAVLCAKIGGLRGGLEGWRRWGRNLEMDLVSR